MLYNALWFRVIQRGRLLASNVDPREVTTITRRYLFGGPLYLVAFGLAFVNPSLSIALDAGLAIFWAFTGQVTRSEVRRHAAPATVEEP